MEIRDILIKWAEGVKDDIQKKIVDTRTVDSGDLLRSVNYTLANNNKVRFTMLRYGKYTDEGKPVGRNWIKDPRKEPAPRNFFRKVIEMSEDDLATILDNAFTDEIESELNDAFNVRGRNFNSTTRSETQRTGRTSRI